MSKFNDEFNEVNDFLIKEYEMSKVSNKATDEQIRNFIAVEVKYLYIKERRMLKKNALLKHLRTVYKGQENVVIKSHQWSRNLKRMLAMKELKINDATYSDKEITFGEYFPKLEPLSFGMSRTDCLMDCLMGSDPSLRFKFIDRFGHLANLDY